MAQSVSKGQCIFCGQLWGEVSKSNEHVLGHLRRRPGNLPNERTSQSAGLTFDVESQQFVWHPVITQTRDSSLLNLRTRAVCESCNTGWMSRLEQQAKPLLIALEEAAKGGGKPLNFARSEALTLARWALKTAITHELTMDGPRVANTLMVNCLREGKVIRGSIVWFARNQDDLDLQIRHAHIEISDTPVVRSGDPYRLVFLVAITWHYLTLLVYVGTPGRLGPSLPFDRWTPVWPCSASGVEYPPMLAISFAELNSRLTDQRDWLPVIRHRGLRQP